MTLANNEVKSTLRERLTTPTQYARSGLVRAFLIGAELSALSTTYVVECACEWQVNAGQSNARIDAEKSSLTPAL